MNRKKLLFVLPSGDIGGTRTSLLNLLNYMDTDRYEIDLLLLMRRGPFVAQFEQKCNVLPQNKLIKAGRGSGMALIKGLDFVGLWRRALISIKAKIKKRSRYDAVYEQAAADYSGYDCVIAYQEKDATYFAQYVDAPRKIAFVHTDFSRAIKGEGNSEAVFSKVCNKFDRVVFVSKACMMEFKEKTHVEQSKMLHIYNTFDCDGIIAKSADPIVMHNDGLPMLVSAGRFCEQKSFDRVVFAAARLKSEGYSFRWHILGDGELFDDIKSAVDEAELGDCVKLEGRKENPYPFIAAADAMILTSVFEAHPMVATEAFILGTPVVSAAFPSAAESVIDLQNGILCDNSANGVYSGVKRILDDASLLKSLHDNLESFCYDNAAIVRKIEELIEG